MARGGGRDRDGRQREHTREYLEDVLTRLPAMKASEAASLTPANWLAARTTKATRQAA